MYNCWKSRRNLFYLGCCQYSDNKSMLIHEEGRFPSCYTLLSKNYSTGYFALTNFEAMRKQLGQQSLPVILGEGVHQVIMDIALSHPSKFPNLFPMLEFSAWQRWLYTTHILAKCFGSHTIESVLPGGHYVCSLLGIQIIKGDLEILKWKAFLAENTSNEWVIYKDAIKKLCLKLCSKVSKDVIVAYDEWY